MVEPEKIFQKDDEPGLPGRRRVHGGDPNPPKVLMTVHFDQEIAPTIADVVRKYGIRPELIDSEFGVVEVDPSDHAYSILVDPEAASQTAGKPTNNLEGPYANPEIAPFSFRGR